MKLYLCSSCYTQGLWELYWEPEPDPGWPGPGAGDRVKFPEKHFIRVGGDLCIEVVKYDWVKCSKISADISNY